MIGETALIVCVPGVEPHVADLRARFDYRSAEGVPAHVTVLSPFVAHPVDGTDIGRLGRLFAGFRAFDFCLRDTGRWPDNLHLRPDPSEPFVALTKAVWAAFPDYPPYEARFPDIVPHLSVAQGPSSLLDEAEPLLRKALPLHGVAARCTQISLITKTGSTWDELERFRLATPG